MSKYGIGECPHCGGKDFFVKQSISGIGYFYGTLDGREGDNTELHSGLKYKNLSKYAYCVDCQKRMFKITDDMDLL